MLAKDKTVAEVGFGFVVLFLIKEQVAKVDICVRLLVVHAELLSLFETKVIIFKGIGIVAKQGNGGMGITYAIMVELYAILSLIISILMVTGV